MAELTTTMSDLDEGADDTRRTPKEPGLVMVYAADLTASPRAFVLHGRVHVVGREPGPGGFALTQPAVSRMHASISVDRDGVRIRDLGSRNGTWVNSERITEAPLSHGDDVRIGDALFVFVDDDASVHLPYRLDGSIADGAPKITIPEMAGGHAMARLSAEVDAAAKSGSATLILGETGVGKELVARGVHAASGRSGPLAAVNCAALSPQLVESELFGYERGAFTGATRSHEGLVRSAHGGTLFLDEVGDLSLEAQAKLLRVLATREVLPVGATRASTVDVRVVCATHRDLEALIHQQRFRADLYSRIAASTIHVPPLRERKEDIYLLVRRLLAAVGAGDRTLSFALMAKLVRHDWPFNVRELANVVQRAASLATEGDLGVRHLPKDFGVRRERSETKDEPRPAGAAARRRSPSEEELKRMLASHKGNVSAVARELERDPTQVYRWLKKFGLDPESFRGDED
jgi:transcriptional regulator of acetoin/glycerol metabolism